MPQPFIEVPLANDVHLAWRDSDIVVLDVKNDAYALLVDGKRTVRPTDRPGFVAAHPEAIALLEDAGFLSTQPTPGFSPDLKAPTSDLLNAGVPGGIDMMCALLSGAFSTAEFHRRRFPALIARARSRSIRSSRFGGDLAASAAAFRAVQPWLPYEGDCLQRAYMLHRYLRGQGHHARWVFGIRTWPFLAHCWVQVGAVVVGDSRERVVGFTPILVI